MKSTVLLLRKSLRAKKLSECFNLIVKTSVSIILLTSQFFKLFKETLEREPEVYMPKVPIITYRKVGVGCRERERERERIIEENCACVFSFFLRIFIGV